MPDELAGLVHRCRRVACCAVGIGQFCDGHALGIDGKALICHVVEAAVHLNLIEPEPIRCLGRREVEAYVSRRLSPAVEVAVGHFVVVLHVVRIGKRIVRGCRAADGDALPGVPVLGELHQSGRHVVAVFCPHADADIVDWRTLHELDGIGVAALLIASDAGPCCVVVVDHVLLGVAVVEACAARRRGGRRGSQLLRQRDVELRPGEFQEARFRRGIDEDDVLDVLYGERLILLYLQPLLAVGRAEHLVVFPKRVGHGEVLYVRGLWQGNACIVSLAHDDGLEQFDVGLVGRCVEGGRAVHVFAAAYEAGTCGVEVCEVTLAEGVL